MEKEEEKVEGVVERVGPADDGRVRAKDEARLDIVSFDCCCCCWG